MQYKIFEFLNIKIEIKAPTSKYENLNAHLRSHFIRNMLVINKNILLKFSFSSFFNSENLIVCIIYSSLNSKISTQDHVSCYQLYVQFSYGR